MIVALILLVGLLSLAAIPVLLVAFAYAMKGILAGWLGVFRLCGCPQDGSVL